MCRSGSLKIVNSGWQGRVKGDYHAAPQACVSAPSWLLISTAGSRLIEDGRVKGNQWAIQQFKNELLH